MPKLSEEPERVNLLAATLEDQYGNRLSLTQIDLLLEQLGKYDGLLVEDAITRHMRDTTLDSHGLPAGRFPPTVADVLRHLQAAGAARAAKLREQQAQKRMQESDQTYTQVVRSQACREALARGVQAYDHLFQQLKLNRREPRDHVLVRRAIDAVRGERGLPANVAEKALGIAQRMLEKRNQEEDHNG